MKRILSLRDTYMLIVGNILGIGIFTTTGYISEFITNPLLMLGLWIIGGFISFCGALTYAELSTRFPRAGGDFVYLSRAYHPLIGFLFGWSALLVTYTGSIAVIGVGFSHYFLNFFPEEIQQLAWNIPLLPLNLTLVKLVAILVTILFTVINVRGVKLGAQWQRIFTLGSILVIILYIIVAFSSEKGSWMNFRIAQLSGDALISPGAAGQALIGIYFTYSGWTILAYIAGEIKEPRRNIPLASFSGVFTVVVLYLLMNITYIFAIPVSEMSGIVDIGYQVLRVLWGQGVSFVFTFIILVAIISTLNSTVLSGARITYAMSRDDRFFKKFGRLHTSFDTPANALWLQCIWAILLILSGSFNQLLTYTVFVMLAFGLLTAVGLLVLRKRKQFLEHPYLAWGYPFTQLIYIGFTLFIMFVTLFNQTLESLSGVFLVLVGLPFYYYFKIKTPGDSQKKIPVS